jgi:hypothetical protein
MTLSGIVYVITCGQCGQTWQRSSAIDGQPMACNFCGRHGRLAIGCNPEEPSAGARRVEAWLMHF